MTDYNISGAAGAAPPSPLGQITEAIGLPLRPVEQAGAVVVPDGNYGGVIVTGGGTVWTVDLTMLDTFTTLLKGLVPAPGAVLGEFLRDDGSWAVPSAAVADGDYGDVLVSGGGTSWVVQGAAGDFIVPSGVVWVGSAASYARLGQKLSLSNVSNYGGAALTTWSATAAEAPILDLNRSKSATPGVYTAVTNGDFVGALSWRASDGGGAFSGVAAIYGYVDTGAIAPTNVPGYLAFMTYGTSGTRERMRVSSGGFLGIKTNVVGTAWTPEQYIDIRQNVYNTASANFGIGFGTTEDSGNRRRGKISFGSNATGSGAGDWFLGISVPTTTSGATSELFRFWSVGLAINHATVAPPVRMLSVRSGNWQLRLDAGTNGIAGIELTMDGSGVGFIGIQSGGSDAVFGNKFSIQPNTAVPVCIFNSTSLEIARFTPQRNLQIGSTALISTGVGCLLLGTITAPTAGTADAVIQYSSDLSAGNTLPSFYCEGGGVVGAGITNVTVTHKVAVRINGTVYYLLATTNGT